MQPVDPLLNSLFFALHGDPPIISTAVSPMIAHQLSSGCYAYIDRKEIRNTSLF